MSGDSGKVVSLSAAREQRSEDSGEHLACQVCGGVWWTTDVVIDKATMSVTGYNADLACVECRDEPPC